MTNYTAKIFNSALSSLNAQQAQLAITSNNIANVNTPGYSRRILNLETRSSGGIASRLNLGNGVQISGVQRMADRFLQHITQKSVADKAAATTEHEFVGRMESLFNLTGVGATVGSSLTNFFGSLNDLSANPSSIELRSNVMERARDLVQSINTTYNNLASLQSEADHRLTVEIQTVNALTNQIANLNSLITTREAGGSVAADERDQRDQLLEQLSEKIGVQIDERSNGAVDITLPNGFALVTGSNSRQIETTQTPSYMANVPPALGGGALHHVVFDYGTENDTAHINLTQMLANGGGVIGGLLRVRGVPGDNDTSAFDAPGYLIESASKIEAISRNLLSVFNETYRGPDPGNGEPSGDLDGNSPGHFGFFTFDGVSGVNGDVGNHAGIDNYSSTIDLAFSDPRALAAAFGVGGVFPTGDGQNLNALIEVQNQTMNFNVGSFNMNGTFDEVYNHAVTHIGNVSARANVNKKVAEDNYITASARRDQVSAVSLDEEFTNLIKFQRGFQASARMLRVADDVLDQIVSLL